jgi:hypothetical protein
MSRSKAVAYLKANNLEASFKQDFNVSFSDLSLATPSTVPPSHSDSAQHSPTWLHPLIGYGDSVTGTIITQDPKTLGHP